MAKLIEAIKNNNTIHYLPFFPEQEKNEIIRCLKQEFKPENVKEISGIKDWKTIKRYKQRIKVIRNADEITNRYGLGHDFYSLLTDGSICVLFSNETFVNPAHESDWIDFMQKPFLFQKYTFKTNNENLEKRMVKIEKTCKIISFLMTRILLLILAAIYLANEILKGEIKESLELILYIGAGIGFMNVFFRFNIYDDLIKKLEIHFFNYLKKKTYRFF